MSCSGSYAYGYGGTQATGTNAYTARARREAEWQQHLDETVCKTPGMKEYGLTAKEIEKIPYTKARNNYHPSAAPYKIFQREELRVASEKKWGGVYDPETKTVRELVEKKKKQQRQHQPEHEQQPAAGPSTPRNPLELPSIGADLEFDLFLSSVASNHTRAVAFRTFVDSHRDATTAYAALEEKKKNKKPRVAVQTPGKKRPAPAAPQSSPLEKKAKRGGKGKGKGKKSIYVDATDSEDEDDEAFVLYDDDDEEEEEDQRVEEKQQEEGDEEVRKPETKIISWTQAKNDFKVTDAELKTIAHTEETTSSGKRTLRFVNTDHVWDLALESHGGLAGHKAHLAKCQARSEKTKATKLANRVKAAAGEA